MTEPRKPLPPPTFYDTIWLMPAAAVLHVFEEAPGFTNWVTHTLHGQFTPAGFIAKNIVFVSVLLVLCLAANFRRTKLPVVLLLVWGSATLFWDFIFQLGTTVVFDRYPPGLITATLFSFPLSISIARSSVRESVVTRGNLWLISLAGAALMAVLIWGGLFRFAH